jgi:YggT family protein
MTSIAQIVYAALEIFKWLIIVKVVMSWLINFQVLNIRQPLVSQVFYGLQRLFEPIYAPIRRLLPNMGGLDITPMIVLFSVFALQVVIRNNFLYA